MEQQMQMPMGAEDMGRATDTVLGHLSLGEVVIPRAFLDDPQVLQMLQAIFQAGGADMAEYTVGDPANKINPETGYPEFFKLKKIFRKIAPIAALALPALAPTLGASLGGAILGSGAAGASTLGNALIGGGLGALSGGGLKGAALGAAGGAIGANLGSLPGSPLSGGIGPTQGEGILGSLGRSTGLSSGNLPSLSNLVGSSGGGSTFGVNNIASALGGFGQDQSLKRQEDILRQANQQQQTNLESLRNIDVTQEPGYQFAVKQGREGLNAALGAQGNLFSGRALQAASDLNQDIATRYYNDAYQREATRLGAGNQLIGNMGEIRANTLGARANNLSQTLSQALGGGKQYSQDDIINLLMANRYAG